MSEKSHNQTIPPETRLRLASRARVQTDKISGQPALLYPEGVLLLNPTGAAIVELCDGQHTFTEMLAKLAVRYNSSPDELSGDVAEYLGRLRERGLLELILEKESSG